ncbi:hypothetical protein [Microbacterium capsulatum]|uniref:Uncharacterized protein n=1 Tax=Microbacterium capsulatum TaxID=3041921 RepID=A0ABU0XKC7_9MICO|nr:hypothetical protein [Microbacterium sp. ASV81]MDQ4215272.1 hypothetical protein [Microbacterium sp. ASV81]
MDPELKLCFDALGKDASIWDEAGNTLETASRTIDGVDVYRGAFSFGALEVADQYAQLHTQVVQLLTDGAREVRAGATALRAVRDDFQRFEDISKSEYYKMWQPAE